MSKKNHNKSDSAGIQSQVNNLCMAMFIFMVLAGAILFATGNLHFGPAAASGPAVENGYAYERGPDELMCAEHGVPEAVCVRCNPSLAAEFKAKGDWCAGHHVPESQCTICNPGLRNIHTENTNTKESLDKIGEAVCEHEIRTIDCDECRYELGVVKFDTTAVQTLVETSKVRVMPRTRTLKLTGQVQLDQVKVVEVIPTGGGQVKRVDKLLGQDVKEGDILAVLHSADLGEAKAHFLEIQANLELAESTFGREKELYEKKVGSQADYLTAANELKAVQARYAAAERRMRLFGLSSEQISNVKTEKANGQFAELVLLAPQSGTIIKQNVSVGALVETNESLFTIADLSNVWVWCDLYETDLSFLHERLMASRNIPAKVRVQAFGSNQFVGVLDLIGSQVDDKTRTVKVRIQVGNEDRRLRPGMFAEAEINVSSGQQITVVPSAAILSDGGINFLFQRWKDNLWVRRDVLIGQGHGDFIEVLDGIDEGTEIASTGAFMFKSEVLKEKMGAGCAH